MYKVYYYQKLAPNHPKFVAKLREGVWVEVWSSTDLNAAIKKFDLERDSYAQVRLEWEMK